MSKEIIIDVGIYRQRVALLSDGALFGLLSRREGDPPQPGDLYLAKLGRRLAEVGGAFVDIGAARDALLPDGDSAAASSEGRRLIVQVARAPLEDKGARVSAKPRLPGRYLVFDPNESTGNVSSRITDAGERARLQSLAMSLSGEGAGITMRTAAAGVAEDTLRAEADGLSRRWREVSASLMESDRPRRLWRDEPIDQALRDHLDGGVERIVVDSAEAAARVTPHLAAGDDRLAVIGPRGTAFLEHDIEDQIEAALAPRVDLPGGGFITIEGTRALTAIDVNAGGRGGAGNAEKAWLEANLAAAAEIARQIRLREIGGQVVIDFINMKPRRNRQRVLAALKGAFADDDGEVRIGGFSDFGLVELSRRRRHPALAERLSEACPVCGGGGHTPSLSGLCDDLLSQVVRAAGHGQSGKVEALAAPALIEALGGAEVVRLVYDKFAIRLTLSPNPALAPADFEVRGG